jgi:hypothetical protein
VISATSLLLPPRIVILKRRHAGELTEDYSDLLWALLGTATHEWIEDSRPVKAEKRRYEAHYMGWTISGEVDDYDPETGVVTDFKVTSAWSIVFGKADWISQLNIYAWLLRRHHLPVNGLQVQAFLKDHSERNVREGSGYPRSPFTVVPVPLWSQETAGEWIAERLGLLEAARLELPECSPEDRWYQAKTKTFNRCAKYCPVRDFCSQFQSKK